jgi:hypothetical protein
MGMENIVKALKSDYRIWTNTLVVALMVYTYLNPIGLPISVGTHAQALYDFIEDLPTGSVAYIECKSAPATYPSTGQCMEDIMAHFHRRGIRFILVATYDAPSVQVSLWALDNTRAEAEQYGREYGVDYVWAGLLGLGSGGGLPIYAAMGEDLTYPVLDYYGTPLAELPLYKEIMADDGKADLFDIDFIVGSHVSPLMYMQTWFFPNNIKIPFVDIEQAYSTPEIMAYYPEWTFSIINDITGTAEYEYLINRPRFPLQNMDVISSTHIMLLILVIVGNVYGFYKRGMEKGR